MLIHTYDFPTPNNAKARCAGITRGPWLFKAFNDKKIFGKYWVELSDFLFKSLNDTLTDLSEIPHFCVADTCDTLIRADLGQTGPSQDWLNEIHPNAKGLEKLGAVLSQSITNQLLLT